MKKVILSVAIASLLPLASLAKSPAHKAVEESKAAVGAVERRAESAAKKAVKEAKKAAHKAHEAAKKAADAVRP